MRKDSKTQRVRSPFTKREREFLLSLARHAKEQNLLNGFQRKVLYDGGYYDNIFVNRLGMINSALNDLEEHLNSDEAAYAYEVRSKGYRVFLHTQAKQGAALTQYYLGDGYRFGLHGLEENQQMAVQWFEKSAEQENPEAMHALAEYYLDGDIIERDGARAVDLFMSSLAAGNNESAESLAYCFLDGIGVPADPKKGMKYLRLATKKGSATAQAKLGDMYFLGTHVRKSLKKAVECYQKSAAEDDHYATRLLGFCYQHGKGVEQDEFKALELYERSSKLGDIFADLYIGKCKLAGIGCEQDDLAAFEKFTEALDYEIDEANFWLARCYQQGWGTPQDFGKSKFHFDAFVKLHSSHDNKFAISHYCLGLFKAGGWGCPVDEKASFEHFLEAAECGYTKAITAIGTAFYNGEPVPQNYGEAVKWLSLAADEDDAEALFYLGECYLLGSGVTEDEKHAVELLQASARLGYEEASEMLVELGLEPAPPVTDDENIHFINDDLTAKARAVYRETFEMHNSSQKKPDRSNVISFKKHRDGEIDEAMKQLDEET